MHHRKFFMDVEVESAIMLMLLTPSSPDEILDARWEDVRNDWIAIDRTPEEPFPLVRSYSPKTRRFAWLSQAALETIENLRQSTGAKAHLFPRLHSMKREERERFLNDFLKDYWKAYEVRISGLQHTFANFAKEYSEFNPEFVNAVMKKKYSRTERHQDFYDFQIKSLLEWWGCNVWRLARAETYRSAYEYGGVDFRMTITARSADANHQDDKIIVKSAFEQNWHDAGRSGAEVSVSPIDRLKNQSEEN